MACEVHGYLDPSLGPRRWFRGQYYRIDCYGLDRKLNRASYKRSKYMKNLEGRRGQNIYTKNRSEQCRSVKDSLWINQAHPTTDTYSGSDILSFLATFCGFFLIPRVSGHLFRENHCKSKKGRMGWKEVEGNDLARN